MVIGDDTLVVDLQIAIDAGIKLLVKRLTETVTQ